MPGKKRGLGMYNKKNLQRSLLAGTSLVSLAFFGTPASAQTTPAQQSGAVVSSGQVEQVIVSASRIDIAGYQQPTPVTVVGSEQLERDAQQSLGDAIRNLPASGSAPGPNNTVTARNISAGQAGVDEVNLRNLGILRTLVLVDGQRVVASNIVGGVDLSTIPSTPDSAD